MQKVKKHGLVGDLWPHIQLMKATGMWLFNYYEDNGPSIKFFRVIYSTVTSVLMLVQFAALLAFLLLDCSGGDQLASGTITFLFFAHSIGKYMYLAFRVNLFYRLLGAWNQVIKFSFSLNTVVYNSFESICLLILRIFSLKKEWSICYKLYRLKTAKKLKCWIIKNL